MNRRNFVKKSIQSSFAIAGGVVVRKLPAFPDRMPDRGVSAMIPMPVQVVIDDVGWWSGKDGSKWQEPYRTGIHRNHVVADYQAIASLGKALGIRPQAAMVLCEWDRKDILKNVPHSTWMGRNWDNSRWVGPWLEEAADMINSNREHFEITMHGLGHEWWTDGLFTRAEWADNSGVMRPKEDIERHLDAFAEIMRQNNLGELPRSFVPTAFRHGFGVTPGNDVSIAELFRNRGFTYTNTPFGIMRNKEHVQYDIFGVDSGMMTVDREDNDLIAWNKISTMPNGVIEGTTCGMHWPNLLHEDPDRNSEIVDAWVNLLAPYHHKQETILAKNSLCFQQQLAHHQCTRIDLLDGVIKLDFTQTNQLGTMTSNDELTVKISSHKELTFSSHNIHIVSVAPRRENNLMRYTLDLRKKEDEVASLYWQ